MRVAIARLRQLVTLVRVPTMLMRVLLLWQRLCQLAALVWRPALLGHVLLRRLWHTWRRRRTSRWHIDHVIPSLRRATREGRRGRWRRRVALRWGVVYRALLLLYAVLLGRSIRRMLLLRGVTELA